MAHAHRIVVGLDLGMEGDVALLEARRIAESSDACELHVVHVLGAKGDRNTEQLARALTAAMDRLRARVSAVLGAASIGDVKIHVRFGDAAATLSQVAIDYDADLLVVGTHARTGVARAVLGSVAETLVRTAHLPVLVARAKDLTGRARTPQPDVARPGAPMHVDQMVSEVVRVGPRTSHISGLV